MQIVNPREELLLKNRILYELYALYYPDDTTVAELARKPIFPYEDTFIKLTQAPEQTVIDYLGIITPPNTVSLTKYIKDNLPYYSRILIRPQIMAKSVEELSAMANSPNLSEEQLQLYMMDLKDIEIVQLLGVLLPFESRLQHYRNIYMAFRNNRFFKINNPSYHRSINSVTVSGRDIMTPNLLLIGFGTPVKYYTYEIADFNYAIRERILYHPENPPQKYTFQEMRSLKDLLYFLPWSYIEIHNLFFRVHDISTQ